jgi:hypothetical protein
MAMEDIQCICHGHLSELLKRAQALEKLNAYVKTLLPQPLQAHCQVANLRDGVLVMQVDSSAWASQMRFVQASVLQAWQVESAQIPRPKQIVVHIVSRYQAPPVVPVKPLLSQHNAELLQSTADCLADSALSHALQKLASNRRQQENED